MAPTTDIIVLVHNRLSITKSFVDRLFANTENFKLIFVDNGSTDGTPQYLSDGELAKKWSVLTIKNNSGVIHGRNHGAKLVTSQFFVNLDNDQYVGPGWLDALHKTMSRGYDIVGKEAWKLVPPKSGSKIVYHGETIDADYYPSRKCKHATDEYSYVGCGGMLIKKSVYEDLGLFDERFAPAYFEDPDFCYRVIKSGGKIGWCPSSHIDHLEHQTISTQHDFNKKDQFRKSWNYFIEKWTPFYPLSRMDYA